MPNSLIDEASKILPALLFAYLYFHGAEIGRIVIIFIVFYVGTLVSKILQPIKARLVNERVVRCDASRKRIVYDISRTWNYLDS